MDLQYLKPDITLIYGKKYQNSPGISLKPGSISGCKTTEVQQLIHSLTHHTNQAIGLMSPRAGPAVFHFLKSLHYVFRNSLPVKHIAHSFQTFPPKSIFLSKK